MSAHRFSRNFGSVFFAVLVSLSVLLVSAKGSSMPVELTFGPFARIDNPGPWMEIFNFYADGTYDRTIETGDSSGVESGLAVFYEDEIGPYVDLEGTVYRYALSPDGVFFVLYNSEVIEGIYALGGSATVYTGDYKASSELVETIKGVTTHYSASNLEYLVFSRLWVESEKGKGIGSWVEVTLRDPDQRGPEEITPKWAIIVNGYAMDPEGFKYNGRVKKLEGSFGREKRNWTLSDTWAVQFLLIDAPPGTEKIRFTVKDVYPGSKYEDLCITKLFIVSEPMQ